MYLLLALLFLLLSTLNYMLGDYWLGVAAAVLSVLFVIGFVKEW